MARPAVKKAKIEEAAIRLFATRGLARTTIKDIASLAGVAEGALYRHYRGKNDMAWQLYCREVQRFSEPLGAILFERAQPFAERLRRAIRFICRYYQDQPIAFSFILLTQHGFPGERLLDENRNPFDMAVRFVREEMRRRSVPKGDPAVLAAMLMGTVLQPLVMHRYGRLRQKPVSLAAKIAAACQRMLKGSSQ